ncbi:MAG: hypothetical protein HY788_01915 [Deltaproteobacteria bacterium]|nr:hypothetical protein [Deltaproteobacteria bacterium]
MKSRSAWWFALPLLFVLVSPSHAFKLEPLSFNGIAWGTDVQGLKDMVLVESQDNDKMYVRVKEEDMMGVAKLDRTSYLFYKNRFCGAVVEFSGKKNFEALKSQLFRRYGIAHRQNEDANVYTWGTPGDDNVNIIFEYEAKSEQGTITYMYIPIAKEKYAAEKKETESSK